MKSKELAEKLLENPDFDVEFSFSENDNSTWRLSIRRFNNIEICDIGYSDKIIVLSGNERDE